MFSGQRPGVGFFNSKDSLKPLLPLQAVSNNTDELMNTVVYAKLKVFY